MKKGVLLRLLHYMTPQIGYLILALTSAIVGVGLSLYAPVLIGHTIDEIVGAGAVNFSAIAPILFKLGIVISSSALFQWLVTLCTNRVAYATIKRLRRELFLKIQEVPLRYIDNHLHGDIINRVVTDVEQISDGLLQGFSQLFTGIITIGGTLGFMLSINPPIALVVALITPLSLFVAAFIARRSYKTFKEQASLRGEMGGYIEEMIGNQKLVQTFSYEQKVQSTFEEMNARLYKSGVRAQFYSSMTNPSTRFVNAVVYASVGIIGALSAVGGGISVGQLSSFLMYAGQYTKPFNEISGVVAEFQSALASARRVFELLDQKPEIPDAADAIVLQKSRGEVDIKTISFSYTAGKPFLEGLSLHADSGQRIAIVGPTGSGKTTIINLLMRFYDVDSGCIKIDGIDIRRIQRNSLRGLYGMVLQDTWLFEGTVWQNIAYGKPDASKDEIVEAAKQANIHRFIQRLPNGYDTILSNTKGSISEGQKQLLCIARVMLKKPSMLLLDEATSNIDTRTEAHIQSAFQKIMKGRTSFIVAHRLSTIINADHILVIREGNIVEQGTHKQLMEQNGFYRELFESQFSNHER